MPIAFVLACAPTRLNEPLPPVAMNCEPVRVVVVVPATAAFVVDVGSGLLEPDPLLPDAQLRRWLG